MQFSAGGIATPADAALMMQLGAEGIFVGSGIFKSEDPRARARAIVEATTHFDEPDRVAAASRELGEAMPGIEIGALGERRAVAEARLVSVVARSPDRSGLPRRARPPGRLRGPREGARGARRRTRIVRVPADLDGSTGSSCPAARPPR